MTLLYKQLSIKGSGKKRAKKLSFKLILIKKI